MKGTIFWDIFLCIMVEIYGCYGGAYRLDHQGDESVSSYQTAWRIIPEDRHLHPGKKL
jgi:hypothetical protein